MKVLKTVVAGTLPGLPSNDAAPTLMSTAELETARATHDRQIGASRRQALWRSGSIWLAALVASGAATYGVDAGLGAAASWLTSNGWVHNTHLVKTLHDMALPTMIAAVALFTGTVASFFSDNTTGALKPVTTRWVMRKSPERPRLEPAIRAEMVNSWQAMQTLDPRLIEGRWALTQLVASLKFTLPRVRDELNLGGTSPRPQAAIERAAAFLGGELMGDETSWPWIVPQSNAMFEELRKTVTPYFQDVSASDLERLRLATLECVRNNRKDVADPTRPSTAQSLIDYFEPMLAQLLQAPRAT